MNIKYTMYTDSGLEREENEDTIYAFEKENCAIFIVADGMGGYGNGKNASDTIVRYMAKFIEVDLDKIIDVKKQFNNSYGARDFYDDIKNCLLTANSDIFDEWTAKGNTSGSTLVMIAFYEDTYCIFWAGDSHIYQIMDDDLLALIKDDVWENDATNIVGLTNKQIEENPNFGRLTNAFGTISDVDIHTIEGTIKSGMKFFLCSDGVYKYCEHSILSKLVTSDNMNVDELGDEIKKRVYQNGAYDNFSFIYVEIK